MTQPSGNVRVPIQREADARDLPLPAYATAGAAGLDLYAAILKPLTLTPGARARVSTGIRVAVPSGYEAQIRARSGRAWRDGLGLVNAPGTIDSDYRGPIQVILVNWGQETVTIRRGDRIAQMVVAPVARVAWDENDALEKTARQDGGFGHTDKAAKGDGDVPAARP